MPILSNPQIRKIVVPVAGDVKVILVCRDYTTSEYARFMGGRFDFKKKGKFDDRSMQARIDFIDTLLMDIEAIDKEGNADYVAYANGGKVEKLTPQVENWKSYVNPSWKISAALTLEGESAEVQEETIKNS